MAEPDLLVTKFTIPPVRSAKLERSHLLLMLDQSGSVPLTLLSASAGFGKTTLLASWASQRSSRVAWLSLDEQDNYPTRFWAYVIAALRRSGPRLVNVGEAALAMIYTAHPPLLTHVLTSLINELATIGQDTALILDDYHLIREQGIHESLQFLLDHLPACLHLLIASRSEPPLALTRLRVRGQLVEIRDTDLRLDSREAESFLNEVMRLSLAQEDIDLLETRTEGWIAGLQLAALSMRRHDDVSAFSRAFRGSQRFIVDYVQEEILRPLPETLQRFLLHTSVLERMNADVCRQLAGAEDSQQVLEKLERSNLFLIPLDEERRWYRWHTLFREVLLTRLQAQEPEQVARLHREAALWYQRQGWFHEGLPHALATQDMFFVAELLEESVERLSQRGELQTVLTWVKLLPLEVLRHHPRVATNYILAFYVLFPFSGQQQEERVYLQQLRTGVVQVLEDKDGVMLAQAERERLRHRLIVLDSWELVAKALSDGNVEQLSESAEQVQGLAPDDDPLWQQHKLAPFGMTWRMAGNFLPMVAGSQEARKIAQAKQNRYLEAQILWGQIVALIALGRLREAYNECEEMQRLVTALGEPLPVAAYPNAFRAELAYEWNHLEVAKNEALIAIEKTAPLQYIDILLLAYVVLVRVCIAQGDLEGAEQAIGEMEQVNKNTDIPLLRPWVESLRVQVWLAQGELARAVEWAEQTSYLREIFVYSREIAALTLARVYLVDRRYPQALQLLETLLNRAEQVSRMESVIALLALQVATLQASGATQEACHVLDRLLMVAEPEGYLRAFLDAGEPMFAALQEWFKIAQHIDPPATTSYARKILSAFSSSHIYIMQQERRVAVPKAVLPTSAHMLSEALTPREMEVLQLLAEGMSNQEIAERLVVSLATAKKHVASILSKLGAENRTQAIARAREYALL